MSFHKFVPTLIATLLLSRADARQREIATRVDLEAVRDLLARVFPAAAKQMAVESPLSGIDASLGSGLARVSDVDDDHVWLARFGQNLLYFFTDRHLVTEPSNDVGQPL